MNIQYGRTGVNVSGRDGVANNATMIIDGSVRSVRVGDVELGGQNRHNSEEKRRSLQKLLHVPLFIKE